MPKTRWTRAEVKMLIENYKNKTTVELMDMFPRHSVKSIERQIEKLRSEGKIGYRSKRTIKRSYRQRTTKPRSKRPKTIIYEDYEYEEIDNEDNEE